MKLVSLRTFVILLPAFFLPLLGSCAPEPLPPMRQSVYVWQQQWSGAVREGVATAAPSVDDFAVLAGRLDAVEDALQPSTIGVDWDALKRSGRPLLLVFRAHVLPKLATAEGRRLAVAAFTTLYQQTEAAAAAAGATPAGMELDYDCPTARLDAYAGLVAELKAQLPAVPLSITALPDWLRSEEFAALIAPLDHYVLQVHALEVPKTMDDPVSLCDSSRIPGWVARAGAFQRPFLVALPSYGYHLYYAEDGSFSGIAAEGAEAAFGAHTRELHADPAAMARVVRELAMDRPRNCRGIIWFRLPVSGDALNWNWPVLAGVMRGEAPALKITAEIRTPEPNLYEVWVSNASGHQPNGPVHIAVEISGATVLAQDGINSFRIEGGRDSEPLQLTGPAPPPGDPKMAAWFRLGPESGSKVSPVKVSSVELVP